MAKIKLNGDTSGYIEISAPAVSGNNTLELGPGTRILTNLDNTFTGVSTFTSGLHVTGGSFGLGTDNPASKLEVKAASAPHITSVFSTTDHITMTTGGSGGGLHITSGNHFAINHQPFADRAGDTNLIERFRITSAGRLGVGLVSPNSNLHVKGGSESTDNLLLTLQSNGVANDGSLSTGLRLINSTSDTSIHGADIRAIRTGSATADLTFSLYNGNNSPDERLRITSDGKVGINDTTPVTKLVVRDTLQASASNHYSFIVKGDDNGTNGESAYIFLSAIDAFTRGVAIGAELQSTSNNHDLVFKTSNISAAPTEKLRITSDGNVLVGNTTPTTTASPVNLSLGGTFSNNGGQNPKLNLWENGAGGDYMSLGVSSNQLEFMMSRDDYDVVWYGRNDSNTGPEERMRLDNGEKLLDFAGTSKIRLKGGNNPGTAHAHLNIGSDGHANTDTRAIDIWGNWSNQESKSITWSHGTTNTNDMVCQQRVRYNSGPSSTVYEIGRFYNGQNTTAFPFQLQSTGTATADLTIDGQIYNRNQSFVAYSTQNNNIQSSTKIDYTVSSSYANVFNNTNSRFTAQRAGLYLFYVRHWFIAGSTGTCYLDMMKNGTSVKEFRVTHPSSSTEYETIQGTALVSMAVNDYMEVNGSAAGGASLHESTGSRHSEFSGFYVSG